MIFKKRNLSTVTNMIYKYRAATLNNTIHKLYKKNPYKYTKSKRRAFLFRSKMKYFKTKYVSNGTVRVIDSDLIR